MAKSPKYGNFNAPKAPPSPLLPPNRTTIPLPPTSRTVNAANKAAANANVAPPASAPVAKTRSPRSSGVSKLTQQPDEFWKWNSWKPYTAIGAGMGVTGGAAWFGNKVQQEELEAQQAEANAPKAISGEATPAEKALAAEKAKTEAEAKATQEKLNPTKLSGGMPDGTMTAKQYSEYLNNSLNNPDSAIRKGLQNMNMEQQRQLDNNYSQMRDAEMRRQEQIPNPIGYQAEGDDVRDAGFYDDSFPASLPQNRQRNTALDKAVALNQQYYNKQNGAPLGPTMPSAPSSNPIGMRGPSGQAGQMGDGLPSWATGMKEFYANNPELMQGAAGVGGAAGIGAAGMVGNSGTSLNPAQLALSAKNIAGEAKTASQIAQSPTLRQGVQAVGREAGAVAQGGNILTKSLKNAAKVLAPWDALSQTTTEQFGVSFSPYDVMGRAMQNAGTLYGNTFNGENGDYENVFEDWTTNSPFKGARANALGKALERGTGGRDGFYGNYVAPFAAPLSAGMSGLTWGGSDAAYGTVMDNYVDSNFSKNANIDRDPMGVGNLINYVGNKTMGQGDRTHQGVKKPQRSNSQYNIPLGY